MKGFIYLIKESDDSNRYKIGMTKKAVTKRKKELQTGNSNELQTILTYETETPYKLEQMLHFYYKEYNVINEWFELTDEQVNEFKDICDKKQNIINTLKENNFFKAI